MNPIHYGTLASGRRVDLHTLRNGHGLEVRFISLGGCITEIAVPDRRGRVANIVLGHQSLAGYEAGTACFGALIGRYGNRIAKGRFVLDGKAYHLPLNNGGNSLHGGPAGFHRQIWQVAESHQPGGVSAALSYSSTDGEAGFPGTLSATVIYTLDDTNTLRIAYEATTDEPTVLNLTNHSYFDLDGNGSGTALQQLVQINADRYTPTDAAQIPTGEIASVSATPMDFRQLRPIGARIDQAFPQLVFGRGYDHNWVLNKPRPDELTFAARAYAPASGRIMNIHTTQPGVQFYTGNALDGTVVGSSGTIYRQGAGYAFETQHFPDSPNHPQFPTTVLRPGEIFRSTTTFSFSTDG